jgi:hypothetical protein
MKLNLLPASPRPGFINLSTRPTVAHPARRAIEFFILFVLLGPVAPAQTILGTTGAYAVMAGSTVTSTGVTTINGNLGAANLVGSVTLTPPSALVTPITAQNLTDFNRAFSGLGGMAMTRDLTGLILGTTATATTLTPGVYRFTDTAQLTGNLILDAQNQPNAVWVFQIGSTLTTAASSSVTFANLAANSVTNNGLFWKVGSTTVFGANTTFEGNVLSGTTFSFDSGATIVHGRALTGAAQTITLAGNTLIFIGADSGYSGGLAFSDSGNSISAVPEPSTYALVAGVLACGAAAVQRRRQRSAVRPPRSTDST